MERHHADDPICASHDARTFIRCSSATPPERRTVSGGISSLTTCVPSPRGAPSHPSPRGEPRLPRGVESRRDGGEVPRGEPNPPRGETELILAVRRIDSSVSRTIATPVPRGGVVLSSLLLWSLKQVVGVATFDGDRQLEVRRHAEVRVAPKRVRERDVDEEKALLEQPPPAK